MKKEAPLFPVAYTWAYRHSLGVQTWSARGLKATFKVDGSSNLCHRLAQVKIAKHAIL